MRKSMTWLLLLVVYEYDDDDNFHVDDDAIGGGDGPGVGWIAVVAVDSSAGICLALVWAYC